MIFEQDRRGSLRPANFAMDEIARRSLPVTPEVFAVFYAVAVGAPAEVVGEIEKYDTEGRPVTSELAVELWLRYIGGPADDAAKGIANELERLLGRIADKISVAESAELETAVGELSREIGSAGMPAKVKASLLSVVKSSRGISARDRALEADVTTTTKTIISLQKRLEEAELAAKNAFAEARSDSLTGALNRRAYEECIGGLFGSNYGRMRQASFIAIDLDHFKKVNDEHGHAFGDGVLKESVKRFTGVVRDSGQVFRLGGEEFAVVLPDIPLTQARQIAERIRLSLTGRPIPDGCPPGRGLLMTASFGVAERKSSDTPDSLYKRADKGVYQAKERGRNCVVPMS